MRNLDGTFSKGNPGRPKGTKNKYSAYIYDAECPNRGVYLISAIGCGRYKIGWSTNVSRRIADLQAGSPYPLALLAVSRCHRSVEKYLHSRLDKYRVHNEWFELPGRIVDLLKNPEFTGNKQDAERRNAV